MPGYCTLTAQTRPSCSTARCTCASDADATGVSLELREHLLERPAQLALDVRA